MALITQFSIKVSAGVFQSKFCNILRIAIKNTNAA